MPCRSLPVTIPSYDILSSLIAYRISVSGSLTVCSDTLPQECENYDDESDKGNNNIPLSSSCRRYTNNSTALILSTNSAPIRGGHKSFR